MMRVASKLPVALTGYLAVLSLCAALSGCRRRSLLDQSAAAFRRTVIDSPAQYATAARLTLVPVRTACPTGAVDCSFVDIAAAAIDRAGDVLLAGRGGPLVEFDSTGRVVRMIGQVGSGFGEYRAVRGAVYGPSGTIQVFDLGNFRLLTFGADGHAIRSVQLRPPRAFIGAKLSQRGLVVLTGATGDSVGEMVPATFESVAGDGQTERRLVSVRAPAVRNRSSDLEPMPPFFTPRPHWSPGPAGTLTYLDGVDRNIYRYDSAGRGDLLIRTGMQLRRVTPRDVQRQKRRILRQFSPGWRARTEPTVERSAARARTTFPAFTGVQVLEDATTWVRESPAPRADSVRWDAFRSSGAWLGWTLLPTSTRILAGFADRLLVAARVGRRVVPQWVRVRHRAVPARSRGANAP